MVHTYFAISQEIKDLVEALAKQEMPNHELVVALDHMMHAFSSYMDHQMRSFIALEEKYREKKSKKVREQLKAIVVDCAEATEQVCSRYPELKDIWKELLEESKS